MNAALELRVSGDLHPRLEEDGSSISFVDSGAPVLHYAYLAVEDAHGEPVDAQMRVDGRRVTITVDDAEATYPIVVDPLIFSEVKLTAEDGVFGDLLGFSAAISGDLVIVGSENDEVDNVEAGSATVFRHDNDPLAPR